MSGLRSRYQLVGLAVTVSVFLLPAFAEAAELSELTTLENLASVSRTATDLLIQQSNIHKPIRITGVKLNPTDMGLENVLEAYTQMTIQPVTQMEENTLVTDIPNAVPTLPDAPEFMAKQPGERIAFVSVTQVETQIILSLR
jgi:iron complex outermembrane recepter protein